MSWTKKDIEQLKLSNNWNEIKGKQTKIVKKSLEKTHIETVLEVLNREGVIDKVVPEYEFHNSRKFRFDWAIPSMMIAIEYEGIFSQKSGHTTVSGYTKDCIKYNLAQIEGWKVLRYTAKNYEQLYNDILKLCKK